jgi:hypothetical protein
MALQQDWHKSSYSNGNGGNNCVEGRVQSRADGTAVEIRDTKDRNGPSLKFTREEWKAFVAGVKDGEFDIAA